MYHQAKRVALASGKCGPARPTVGLFASTSSQVIVGISNRADWRENILHDMIRVWPKCHTLIRKSIIKTVLAQEELTYDSNIILC